MYCAGNMTRTPAHRLIHYGAGKGRIVRAEWELVPPATYKKKGVDHVETDGFRARPSQGPKMLPNPDTVPNPNYAE